MDSNDSTASMTSASDVALPDGGATAVLTRTQQVIREVLAVDAQQVGMETLNALMSMEVRQLPSNLSGDHFSCSNNPKLCCFDTTNLPDCAWTCARLCERCALFNRLIQANSTRAHSAVARGILGSCLITTDCASTKEPSGTSPALPVELLDIIINSVIDDMKHSKDGSAVAKLLHTSSSMRRKVSRAFVPITLIECPAQVYYESDGFWVPRPLSNFIWDTLEYFLLTDVFSRRYVKSAASIGEMFEKYSGDLIKMRENGDVATHIDGEVTLDLQELRHPDGTLLHPKAHVRAAISGEESPGSVSVAHASGILEKLLHGLAARVAEDERLAKAPTLMPLCLNVFQRALSGYLDTVFAAVEIVVTLMLQYGNPEHAFSVDNVWQFSTTKGQDKREGSD